MDNFEDWYEATHDLIINNQFEKEGDRYMDRTVRRSSEAWQEQHKWIEVYKAKYDNLQKKLNTIAEVLDSESSNSWGLWKEKADMLEQGASNAYEKAYWMVKEVLDGETK